MAKKKVVAKKEKKGQEKKGQFRSNIVPIIRIFQENEIKERHKEHLRKTPFWLLIQACIEGRVSVTNVHNHHQDAIHLMKMYVPSQKGFRLGKKLVVPFRSSDIESMFGIVDGEKKIEPKKYKVKPTESPFFKRRFANGGRMDQKFIKEMINDLVVIDSPKENEDVARLICIYMFICLFFTSTGTSIGWHFLTLVEDLDTMKDHAWSKAICDATLESVEKNINTPWNLGGCVMALKYWLAMHSTLGKVEFPNEFPIFLRYNTTQLHVSLEEKFFSLTVKNIFKEEIPMHEMVTEMLTRGRYAIVLYRQKDNQEEVATVGVSNDDEEEESRKCKKDDTVEEEEEHGWQNERYSSNDNVQDNYGLDENEKKTMEQEVNELKEEKKNLEEANEKVEQDNRELMEENNNLKAEMEKMKEGMKEGKKRLRLISKEQEMERILQERQTEIEEMKKRMEEMKKKNNSLVDEVNRLRKECKKVRPSSMVIKIKTKPRKKKTLEDYECEQLAKGQKIQKGGKKEKKKEKKKGEKKKEEKKEEEEEEKEEEKRNEKQEKEEEKGKVEAEKKKEEKKTEDRKDEKEEKKAEKRKKEKEEEEEGKREEEKEEEEEGKREDEEAEKKKKRKKEDKKETKKRGTKRATTGKNTPKAKKQRIKTEDKAEMKHDHMETTMGDDDFVTPQPKALMVDDDFVTPQPKALMVDDDFGTEEIPLVVDDLVTPTEKEDREILEFDDAKYPVWSYLDDEDKEKIIKMQHYLGQSAVVWKKTNVDYMISFGTIKDLIQEKKVANAVIEVYMELLRDEQTDKLMPDKVFFFTTNTLAYITKENMKKNCERMIDANVVDAHRHMKMVIPIFTRKDEEKGIEDHWTVVIAENETGEWCPYNSFRPNKRKDKYFEDANIVKEYLNKKRKGGPASNGKRKSEACPQQKNGTDCGIFMINVIDRAFRGNKQMKSVSLTWCQKLRAYLVHRFINEDLSWDEKSYLDFLNETTKLAEKEEEKHAQRQIEEQEKGGEQGDPTAEGND